MKRTIGIILSAAAVLLMGTGNAFATDPLAGFCEEEDCEACGETETCTIATFDQLPRAEKLKNARAQFNVEAAYNSNDDTYYVSADVTAAAGEGIIVVDENNVPGTYATIEDFYDALSTLLDEEIDPVVTDEGDERYVELPNIVVSQTGSTIRLFIDSNGVGTWAPANYRANFIWDVLSDEDGDITIEGKVFNLNPWLNPEVSGNQCPGVDAHSYDTGSGTDIDSEQCSSFGKSRIDVMTGGTSTSPTCAVGGPTNCFVVLQNVSTLAEAGTDLVTNHYRFECEATDFNTTPRDCKLVEGRFVRRRDQIADTLEMQADYYNGTTKVSDDAPVDNNETEISSSGSFPGTCVEGDLSNFGGMPALTYTREGDYDSVQFNCDQAE